MKPLTVWGGCFDGTTRAIVATKTKSEAAAAFAVSMYSFNNWAGDTGNHAEVAVAMTKPGTVFTAPGDNRQHFVEGLHRYRRGGPWPPSGCFIVVPPTPTKEEQ